MAYIQKFIALTTDLWILNQHSDQHAFFLFSFFFLCFFLEQSLIEDIFEICTGQAVIV